MTKEMCGRGAALCSLLLVAVYMYEILSSYEQLNSNFRDQRLSMTETES